MSKPSADAPPEHRHLIFAASDARGTTCELLVRAALVQYPEQSCQIERRGDLVSAEQIQTLVAEASRKQAVIYFTLVSQKMRRAMRAAAQEHTVTVVDLLGPALSALHDMFESSPASVPGLLYQWDRERFDMMDAIDYTLAHDDGRRTHELERAHVVLVGVSRSSKSSTCVYLANNGVRAANVPLVPEVPPPPELLALDPKRVVYLKISLLRLQSVRREREKTLGTTLDSYVDKRQLAQELRAANGLATRRGWHCLDVSYMAIEEVAKQVIKLIRPE